MLLLRNKPPNIMEKRVTTTLSSEAWPYEPEIADIAMHIAAATNCTKQSCPWLAQHGRKKRNMQKRNERKPNYGLSTTECTFDKIKTEDDR